jgi:hypothetical protein
MLIFELLDFASLTFLLSWPRHAHTVSENGNNLATLMPALSAKAGKDGF